jgi:two-component system response regulator TrcR
MDKIKVLLVEDEETLAMIIKDTLEGQSFIIHTAADGEEGLRLFFDLRPDVLVADVMMPRMDGNGTPHPPDRQAHAGAFPHCTLCHQ